jgi:hypothetical protein
MARPLPIASWPPRRRHYPPTNPKEPFDHKAHRAQRHLPSPGFGAARERQKRQFFFVTSVVFVVKKARFLCLRQEYILDTTPPDTHFCQCLQGFRFLKKGVTMACTNSAFCAIIKIKS